jgi:hypothetical protein
MLKPSDLRIHIKCWIVSTALVLQAELPECMVGLQMSGVGSWWALAAALLVVLSGVGMQLAHLADGFDIAVSMV